MSWISDTHSADDEVAMLILQRGGQGSQRWRLDKSEILIGRVPESDIILPDRQVSRRHARIFRRGEVYYIEDLGSKNGTWVNGHPLHGVRALEDGDEIQIALRFKLAFVASGATAPLALDDIADSRQGLYVDLEGRRVFVNGIEIGPPLSPAQFRLLALLWQAKGAVVPREEIIRTVWAEEEAAGVTEQALDALVRRLRERLAEYDPEHRYIVTVRGHGYRLEQKKTT